MAIDNIPPTVQPIQTVEGKATTAEWRAEFENIGPIFRFAGLVLLLADFALVAVLIVSKATITWPVVVLMVGMATAAMLLIRPPGFDNFVKTLADRLPFLSYRKPSE